MALLLFEVAACFHKVCLTLDSSWKSASVRAK